MNERICGLQDIYGSVECKFTIAFQYKFNVTNISTNHISMLTITGLYTILYVTENPTSHAKYLIM